MLEFLAIETINWNRFLVQWTRIARERRATYRLARIRKDDDRRNFVLCCNRRVLMALIRFSLPRLYSFYSICWCASKERLTWKHLVDLVLSLYNLKTGGYCLVLIQIPYIGARRTTHTLP